MKFIEYIGGAEVRGVKVDWDTPESLQVKVREGPSGAAHKRPQGVQDRNASPPVYLRTSQPRTTLKARREADAESDRPSERCGVRGVSGGPTISD